MVLSLRGALRLLAPVASGGLPCGGVGDGLMASCPWGCTQCCTEDLPALMPETENEQRACSPRAAQQGSGVVQSLLGEEAD